ncbi:hypothetical protein CO165_02315 [Candidatus Roizmanbacteria bacterium CG_4_9_14_3_um_filter_33_18]|uniref:Uncharacterized protein n=2 Tax=Candidatus Roizmaniibacteriota TaxID=1752723 RepID=A0A2M7XY66_9BACT|nr:MAG: hypothetical protein COW97_01270 [Candidatus Roizmanbacteria bacterium CG22_combo_CG10-13_8_21_14_all_34_12]PJA55669.1 MAG: hypothetical protein CO165_02315 [Candidatus Roizmanbacteria bacterium CG_4_9_14_3_um_filter_33_18]
MKTSEIALSEAKLLEVRRDNLKHNLDTFGIKIPKRLRTKRGTPSDKAVKIFQEAVPPLVYQFLLSPDVLGINSIFRSLMILHQTRPDLRYSNRLKEKLPTVVLKI